MKIEKIYALSAIFLTSLVLLLALVIPKPLSFYICLAYGPVFLLLVFFALFKFQKAKAPLTLPMICLVAHGFVFEVGLCAGLSSGTLIPILATLLPCILLIASVAFLAITIRLFIRSGENVAPKDSIDLLPFSTQAGFWRRVAAASIDGVILGTGGATIFGIFALCFIAYAMSTAHPNTNQLLSPAGLGMIIIPGFLMGLIAPIAGASDLPLSFVLMARPAAVSEALQILSVISLTLFFLLNLLSIVYFSLMESSVRQASIGKRILGLRVCNQRGERLTFKQALLRNVLKFISFGTLCLGYLYAGISPTKQGLHDLLGKCFVVRK